MFSNDVGVFSRTGEAFYLPNSPAVFEANVFASHVFFQTLIRKPPSVSAKGGFLKAGEAIRTPDIHVGNRGVSDQKRALRVSSGVHPMRLLQLLRVDA